MVALNDPAGIAMDLNGLVIQQIAEVTADPAYYWKYHTATSITMLRDSIRQNAISKEASDRWQAKHDELYWGSSSVQQNAHTGSPPNGPLSPMRRARESEQEVQKYLSEVESAGTLTKKEADTIGDDAWAEYQNRYDPTKLETFTNSAKNRLADQASPLRHLLDEPYVAWLKSTLLADYFECNFDPVDLLSGEAYSMLAGQVLHEASGRAAVADFLRDHLPQSTDDSANWPVRALFANQDDFVINAEQAASGAGTDYDKMAKTLYDKWTGEPTARMKRVGNAMAGYLQQISGLMVERLGKSMTGSFTARMRQDVAVLGALAKLEDPSLNVVTVHGTWSRRQAARTLAKAVSGLAQAQSPRTKSPLGNRSVRRAMDAANQKETEQYAFDGIVLASVGSALVANQAETRLTRAMTDGFEESITSLSKLNVKAGVAGAIFAAVTVGESYRELLNAPESKLWYARGSFASGVSALVGGIAENAGKAARLAAGNEVSPGLRLMFKGTYQLGTAGWLELGGRALGAVGAVIAGVLMFCKGLQERASGNDTLGTIHIVSGGLLALSGAFMLIGGTLGVIGLVIILVIAAIGALIDWLKSSDLQVWLNRSHYFGRQKVLSWIHFQSEEDHQAFKTPVEEAMALEKFMQGA